MVMAVVDGGWYDIYHNFAALCLTEGGELKKHIQVEHLISKLILQPSVKILNWMGEAAEEAH